ncbi:MAG: phage tail tape measure protein [Beijerinckiaceae bacterium]
MNENIDSISTLNVSNLDDIKIALDGVNISADRVSKTMTRAFAGAIVSGKSFEAVLKSLAEQLARMALSAGLKPLQSGLSGLLSSAMSALTGAGGGTPVVAPFADGGIVSRPTFFGTGGGLGLMGERGAEAILPLARGPDGRLGIAARDSASRPANIVVNISTQDVQSFRHSQVQVAGALARAVARGRRGI